MPRSKAVERMGPVLEMNSCARGGSRPGGARGSARPGGARAQAHPRLPWVAGMRALAAGALALAALQCAPAGNPLEEARAVFLDNKVEDSVPLFERAARSRPRDPEPRAWLADALRRLGRHDQADSAAREALRLDPCQSWAHEVLAANFEPMYSGWERTDRDSSWSHIRAAVECDSSNGSAWTGVWLQSLSRGDSLLEARALRALSRTRFFTPAALAYGRWLLRDLPPGALLIVNGDMDTYPLHVLQATESLRPDVVIANRSLLNVGWYRRLLRDRQGVKMPFGAAELDGLDSEEALKQRAFTAGDRMIDGWFGMLRAATLGRPLAVSTTVSEPGLPQDHLVLRGAYYLVSRVPAASPVDTAAVRASLASLRPADFAGPWTSEGDRSPVRRITSPNLAKNVVASAFQSVFAMRRAGHEAGAQEVLAWARRYVAEAGLDSAAREMVEQMAQAAPGAGAGR